MTSRAEVAVGGARRALERAWGGCRGTVEKEIGLRPRHRGWVLALVALAVGYAAGAAWRGGRTEHSPDNKAR